MSSFASTRRLLLAGAVTVLAACASGQGAVAGTASQRGERYSITPQELGSAGANNLYEAVAKLRPEYLRSRGASTITAQTGGSGSKGSGDPAPLSSSTGTAVTTGSIPVRLYINDQMMASIEDMRQIAVADVVEVKFMPGPQAGVRYGTNHTAGVILVRVR